MLRSSSATPETDRAWHQQLCVGASQFLAVSVGSAISTQHLDWGRWVLVCLGVVPGGVLYLAG